MSFVPRKGVLVMPSNVKLSADERTLWMMARCAAKSVVASSKVLTADRGVTFYHTVTNEWADAEADAAILAMRERVAVEAVRIPYVKAVHVEEVAPHTEPPLTPERAREVMREYVAKGTWAEVEPLAFVTAIGDTMTITCYPGEPVEIADGRLPIDCAWHPITTESALRSFCEGRKA